MKKPGVLHIGKYYPPVPGGMEQVLATLCRATQDRIDNEVLAFNESYRTTREMVDGISVTRLRSIAPARSTPIAVDMAHEIRVSRADVVVLHEPNPWALVSCALAKPRQPIVVFFHSEVVRPALQYALFYHPLVRAVYSRAARFVVTSPPMAEHARALRPYRDRVTVVPFGIESSAWELTPARQQRVQEIRGEDGRPLVLFAGRMVAYKGCEILLRALTGVDANAVLAGDGPLRPKLQRLAAELGLGGRVHFPGAVPDEELVALYHAADVFVLPSITRAEAFGFVQVEAMACGTPVISTSLPSGVPWVNQHGVTGLVIEPNHVGALRGAVTSLLADPQTRARMGAAGKRRVAKEFAIAKMADRMSALLEEVAGGRAVNV